MMLLIGCDYHPIRTLAGTAMGSLIGLLGGPVGVAVAGTAGAVAGSFGDLFVAGVDADFLDEVSTMLVPGKYALVADISEEWVTPVDTRMGALNGVVFRTTRSTFEQEQRAKAQAALRAEIGQMKAEHARQRRPQSQDSVKNRSTQRQAAEETRSGKAKV